MADKQKECFSYIVADDCGYAPNPWWGAATLAVCKPVIRKGAKEGDLIVGLAPKKLGYGLVYAMVVEEILSLGDYYLDPRFDRKKPDFNSEDRRLWMGDNFYEPSGRGHLRHLSAHNIKGRDQATLAERQVRDLRGVNVLIAGLFYYFGRELPQLPMSLHFLQAGRGHKKFGVEAVLKFERDAASLLKTPGIHGEPRTLDKEVKKLEYLHE